MKGEVEAQRHVCITPLRGTKVRVIVLKGVRF